MITTCFFVFILRKWLKKKPDNRNYRHFYNNLCKGLNEVKAQLGLKELTTYWARHSWATIARKLKISKDTIALALGHGSHTVTDIYIEEDMAEVDEANRKVLDYVLYGGTKSEARQRKSVAVLGRMIRRKRIKKPPNRQSDRKHL